MNICSLNLNFVECESFLESNYLHTLAPSERNLDDSIDSGNFSVRGYLPLIRKDSITQIHGLTVYVKEGLPFVWDLSLENSADSYLCFPLALLHSVSFFLFLLVLNARLSILFHATHMMFCRSTHLLMCLSLEALTFIIRTG